MEPIRLGRLAVTQDGALLPRTLAAKQAQAASALGIWPGGWTGLRTALPRAVALLPGPLGALLLALALLGLWRLAGRRPLPPLHLALLAWGALHLVLVALLFLLFHPPPDYLDSVVGRLARTFHGFLLNA